MDKITNINQDININNFNIFKKTNKLIINEIIPFINDYLKIINQCNIELNQLIDLPELKNLYFIKKVGAIRPFFIDLSK